jgi:hypothetical protein
MRDVWERMLDEVVTVVVMSVVGGCQ